MYRLATVAIWLLTLFPLMTLAHPKSSVVIDIEHCDDKCVRCVRDVFLRTGCRECVTGFRPRSGKCVPVQGLGVPQAGEVSIVVAIAVAVVLALFGGFVCTFFILRRLAVAQSPSQDDTTSDNEANSRDLELGHSEKSVTPKLVQSSDEEFEPLSPPFSLSDFE